MPMVELKASESPVPFLAAPMRILVVEDDFLLADMLTGLLEDHGVVVVGPVAGLEDAMNLATVERLDGAILDVRLGRGSNTFPVAETLAQRAVPFIFMTAYDDSILPAALAGRPLLRKPLDQAALPDILEEHFGA
jgi:DNA-binding response OmpR family regulator